MTDKTAGQPAENPNEQVVDGFSNHDLDHHTATTIGILRAPSLLFAAATVLVGVANFAYHPLVADSLTLNEYGALGALLGFLMVLAVPVATMQLVLARDIAEARGFDGRQADIRPVFAWSFAFAVGLSALTAMSLPLFERFFDLPSASAGVLLAATVFPTVVQVVPIAVLLSRSKFAISAVALLVGAGIRLAAGEILSGSNGLSGAMAANLFGASGTAVFSLVASWIVLAREKHSPAATAKPPSLQIRSAAIAIIGLTGFWALHAVHPMVARVFLDSDSSGNYAAAATLGQLSVFIPALVALWAFPKMAKERGRGPAARAHLIKALAAAFPMALVLALVTTLAGGGIVDLLLGDKFDPQGAVLGLVSFSSATAALVYLLVYFFLAGRSRAGGIVAWAGVVAFCLMSLWFHATARQIAEHALVTTLFVFGILVVLAMSKGREPIRNAAPNNDTLWDGSTEMLDLTMVVPFYNPGDALLSNIGDLAATLDRESLTYEIIAVSDGSTDHSADALEMQKLDHVRVVRQSRNKGKGQALRVGLEMGRGRYLGFIDADGDIAPENLSSFLVIMEAYQPDIIFGSKRHPLSKVKKSPLRWIYSFGYQLLVRVLFRVNVSDTQVGLKLVRRDVLAAALPRMLEKRFSFDLELFVVSRHVGFTRVFEAPVVIRESLTSTVSFGSVRGVLLDTLAIFYRLHLLHFYDEPQQLDIDGRPVVTRSSSS